MASFEDCFIVGAIFYISGLAVDPIPVIIEKIVDDVAYYKSIDVQIVGQIKRVSPS